MLPRYRRLVEQLAQTGLLKVICGTDTLGVGINVPIRTVVFTGLAKYDGTKHRLLKAREFHQIAGRAGRAGFDTSGYVVVQAPDHVIDRTRALAKAGDDPKKRRKVQTKKPPEGETSWTEETFSRLRDASPEALVSRMRVDHSMILNVVNQPGDAVETMRGLVEDNHEDERGRAKLSEQARALGDELVGAGVLEWLAEPDEDGRTLRLAIDLQEDFALNQPLASFALKAFELIDPESEDPTLDVVSIVEAGSRVTSAAAAVSSFAVEAGTAGSAASTSSRTSPVATSTTSAETPAPRPGAVSSGVSWVLRTVGSGAGASVARDASTGAASVRSGSSASGTSTASALSSPPPASRTPTPMTPATSSSTRPTMPIARRRRKRPVFAVTIVEPLDAMVPTPQKVTSAEHAGPPWARLCGCSST